MISEEQKRATISALLDKAGVSEKRKELANKKVGDPLRAIVMEELQSELPDSEAFKVTEAIVSKFLKRMGV